MADAQRQELGWWCISGEVVLAALRRCAAGENPDIVYAELYAGSDHEYFHDNPDWRG